MSDEALELIASWFRVLAEPSRLRILRSLEEGEKNITELVAATGLTQANVSRHVQSLVASGMVGRRRQGLQAICFIADPDHHRTLRQRVQQHAEADRPAGEAPGRQMTTETAGHRRLDSHSHSSARVPGRFQAGRRDVMNLDGGIFAWVNAGHPVERDGKPAAQVQPVSRLFRRLLRKSARQALRGAAAQLLREAGQDSVTT